MSIPIFKAYRNIFFNEEECIKYLLENNVLHNIERCEQCNSITTRKEKFYICSNQQCRKTVSVLMRSFFSNKNISCCDILLIAYYWIANAKYSTISSITGHSSATIVKYINIFQNLVVNTLTDNDLIIGGKNKIVEIDESKFKKNENWWVVGGVERTAERKCFFEIVEERDKETLKQVIKQRVHQGSIIHTDKWKAYSCVEELGFRHRVVNHSRNRIERGTGVHTNHIEGLWQGVKLNISSRNRNKNIVKNYLLNFAWRRKY